MNRALLLMCLMVFLLGRTAAGSSGEEEETKNSEENNSAETKTEEKEEETDISSNKVVEDVDEDDEQKKVPVPKDYESKVRVFIANLKRKQLAPLIDSTEFIKEINEYTSVVPRNTTQIVTTRRRDECFCEGAMLSPCPMKCFYSCYVELPNVQDWLHVDDCRNFTREAFPKCKCSAESETECGKTLENCLQETTTETTTETKLDIDCPNLNKGNSVDGALLVEYYKQTVTSLIEPAKKSLRELDLHVNFYEQASTAHRTLLGVVSETCTDKDRGCSDQAASEITETLSGMRKNITNELIKTQMQIEEIVKKVVSLRENVLSQIHSKQQEYKTCLSHLSNCHDEATAKGVIIHIEATLTHPWHRTYADKASGGYQRLAEDVVRGVEQLFDQPMDTVEPSCSSRILNRRPTITAILKGCQNRYVSQPRVQSWHTLIGADIAFPNSCSPWAITRIKSKIWERIETAQALGSYGIYLNDKSAAPITVESFTE